jgi:hypothetical protein
VYGRVCRRVPTVVCSLEILREAAALLLTSLCREQGEDGRRAALQACPVLRTVHKRSRASIRVVPTYLIAHVLVFLDGRTLTRCDRVCKAWRSIAAADGVWRAVVRAELGDTPGPSQGVSVRQQYLDHRRAEQEARVAAVRALVQEQLRERAPGLQQRVDLRL